MADRGAIAKKKNKKEDDKTKKTRRRSTAYSKARKTQRKVVVLGSKKCGKTAFIKRFVTGEFLETYTPTVEDLYVHSFKHQARHYTLQITDMASPFQFPAMRDLHIRAAELILLLYQIDSEPSYAEAHQVFNIVRSLRKDVPVILVGTREDEVAADRRDSQEYMDKFFKNDIPANSHILTSAKVGKGVREAFEAGCDECRKLKKQNSIALEEEGVDEDTRSTTSSIGEDEKCTIL